MIAAVDFAHVMTELPTLQFAQIDCVAAEVPVEWTLQLANLEIERMERRTVDPAGWDLFAQVRPLKDELEDDGRLGEGEWGTMTYLPDLLDIRNDGAGYVSTRVRTLALLSTIIDTHSAKELAKDLVFEQLIVAARAYAAPKAASLTRHNKERIVQFFTTTSGLADADLPNHLPQPGIAIISPNGDNFLPPGAAKDIPLDMSPEQLPDAYLRGLILQQVFTPLKNKLDAPIIDLEGNKSEQDEIIRRRRSYPNTLFEKGLFQLSFEEGIPFPVKKAVETSQHGILLSGLRLEAAVLRGSNNDTPLPDWARREGRNERKARLERQRSLRQTKYLTMRYDPSVLGPLLLLDFIRSRHSFC